MRVYLAVPLISHRSLSRTKLMAAAIQAAGHEVASPWNLEPTEVARPSAANIFDRDRKGSEAAEVMVADATHPSTGVGMEIMAAYKAGRRIIIVSKRGRRISKMLEDMDRKAWIQYGSSSELYDSLLRELKDAR